MNNYYEFTKFNEDGLAMDMFNFMPDEKIKRILDDYFNDIENYLKESANTFKTLFKGKDYDEYYYQVKSLIEQLNDIKIILNILLEKKLINIFVINFLVYMVDNILV